MGIVTTTSFNKATITRLAMTTHDECNEANLHSDEPFNGMNFTLQALKVVVKALVEGGIDMDDIVTEVENAGNEAEKELQAKGEVV